MRRIILASLALMTIAPGALAQSNEPVILGPPTYIIMNNDPNDLTMVIPDGSVGIVGCVNEIDWRYPEPGTTYRTPILTYSVVNNLQRMDVEVNPHSGTIRMTFTHGNNEPVRIREQNLGTGSPSYSADVGVDLLFGPALEAARERVQLEIHAVSADHPNASEPGRGDFIVRYNRPCS